MSGLNDVSGPASLVSGRSTAPDSDSRPSPAHDLRLVPVAAAGWAGAWVGTGLTGPDRWSLIAAGVVLLVVATLCLIAHRWRLVVMGAAALVLVGTVAVGALAAQRLSTGPVADLAGYRAVVAADAVVRSDPQVRAGQFGGYATVRVRLTAITGRGQTWAIRAPVLLIVGGDEAVDSWRRVLVGSTVRVTGRLETVERGSEVAAVLRLRQGADIRAPPGASLRLVERVRDGLRSAVARRPAEPRALVPALVLGDTSAMTDDLQQSFQATGLTHLTAVSGANLTLLLAFLLFAAKWLGVRGRWLRVVGLAGVVVFVALCRTEPSVLRAAAMGLVALAALGAGGGRKGLRQLAVAVLVLVLVDPFLARSVGFALSVLASAGIVWWASSWVREAWWLPRPLAEAVAVPLAAHLATLPVVAALSGAVSVSGLLANALAGPFVGPATVLGFAAAGLSLLSSWLAAIAGLGSIVVRAGDHLDRSCRRGSAGVVVAVAGDAGGAGRARRCRPGGGCVRPGARPSSVVGPGCLCAARGRDVDRTGSARLAPTRLEAGGVLGGSGRRAGAAGRTGSGHRDRRRT